MYFTSMAYLRRCSSLVLLTIIILSSCSESSSKLGSISAETSTFLSPRFELSSGLVENKFYFGVDFPSGHVAVKSFDAELVDEDGTSVPLSDAYLHHWIVLKYFHRPGTNVTMENFAAAEQRGDIIFSEISGLCQSGVLKQHWGLGSETRRTETLIPEPYAIEIGNPGKVPPGYEEKWMFNIHAIDTRGVADKRGCLECRCDLYNVTVDTEGQPLPKGYMGGLKCCGDQYQCKLGDGPIAARRGMFLKYTLRWKKWDSSVLPVKIFILDVTDSGARNSSNNDVGCQIEYQVPACKNHQKNYKECMYSRRAALRMPTGGYLVYGVGHLHVGGRNIALRKLDGREICASKPIYGRGNEAGNEKGYVVGMSACYPQPGSVKIEKEEMIILESEYENQVSHSGVMALFYVLLADDLP